MDTLQSLLQLDGSIGVSSGEAAAQPDNIEAANSTSFAGILSIVLLFSSWNLNLQLITCKSLLCYQSHVIWGAGNSVIIVMAFKALVMTMLGTLRPCPWLDVAFCSSFLPVLYECICDCILCSLSV